MALFRWSHRKREQLDNDEFVNLSDLGQQHDQGQFLERLLIPSDLRNIVCSTAPLVLLVDRETARLNWEVLCSPDPIRQVADIDQADKADLALAHFWATSRTKG